MFSSLALLNQGLNSNNENERRACVFCGLSNYKCHKYLKVKNPSARKEICKKYKNCFVCFKIGHNAKSCTREDNKCKNSNGKHNFSIFTFNKNLRQSRFDNLSNPSSSNLANNQANDLLQTAFLKVGDLHL